MNILLATFHREWQLAWRNLADAVNPVAFFLMVIALVPLGTGTDKTLLAAIAPGILWVAALLASLLSVDMLFRRIVWIKVLVHWLFSGLPLVLISPLLGMMLSLPPVAMPVLMLSLALGTISLSLIGAIGAALTVSLRRGGLLIAVIVLPLYIPVLIFGASATAQAAGGIFPAGQLAILGACALFALGLSPLVVMAGLKNALES